MKILSHQGINFSYADQGQGIPVVMVHCSSASHKEWRGMDTVLGDYRLLAPDLIGYGETGAWPEDREIDLMADVHMLCALVDSLGEPVHLLGHSYGGVVCMETARLANGKVLSLCLIEPVAFHLLKDSPFQREWQEALQLANSVITAMQRGKRGAAARYYMGYWVGIVAWWFMSRRQKHYILSTMDKVSNEFKLISQIQVDPNAYKDIRVPVSLIFGGKTKNPPKAIIKVLQQLLEQTQTYEVQGAGHMSPFSHQQEIHLLIQEHFSKLR